MKAFAVSLLFACGPTARPAPERAPTPVTQPEAPAAPVAPSARPAWIDRGSRNDIADRALFAVGQATGIKNPSLARSTADNRARAEISKMFETLAAAMTKDFQMGVSAGSSSGDSQAVTVSVRGAAAEALGGVEIIEHWVDADGTIYALARLPHDAVIESLSRSKELTAKTKDAVVKQAVRVLGEAP